MQSPFNIDVLLEVLGNLSPQEVLRCRQICRYMSSATRERSLWITLHRRNTSPVCRIDLSNCSVDEIEVALCRAERLHHKLTRPQPDLPRVRDPLILLGNTKNPQRSICVGVHGSYIIYIQHWDQSRHPDVVSWYKLDKGAYGAMTPMFRFAITRPRPWIRSLSQLGVDVGCSYELDKETGELLIVDISESGEHMTLTRIRPSEPTFNIQNEVIPTPLVWETKFHGVRIINGYIFCCQNYWSERQAVTIIHARTRKQATAVIQSKLYPKVSLTLGSKVTDYATQIYINERYLVQILDKSAVEVYKLTRWTVQGARQLSSENRTSVELQPSFSGRLPGNFVDIRVFPTSSPTLLAMIGGGELEDMKRGEPYRISLMSLDVSNHAIQVLREIVMKSIACYVDRRLALTYSPAGQCAAGIVATRSSSRHRNHDVAAIIDSSVYQRLHYIRISLDGKPDMFVNDLDIPPELAHQLETFQDVDVFNGRLIVGHYRPSKTEGGRQIGVLDYL